MNQSTLQRPNSFWCGIDWGGRFHHLCVLDGTGQQLLSRKVAHTVDGLAVLVGLIASFTGAVRIAIERAEGLLVEYLQHHCDAEIYCVSPKISARARERYRMAAAKSDEFDAYVLADTLRHQYAQWRPLAVPSPLLAELTAVSRDRQRILDMQVDTENRLRSILDAYHPCPLHLFSALDRDITLSFIRSYPTPVQAGRITAARMGAFTSRHGYSGRHKPETLVARMQPHLLSASDGTVAGKALAAKAFTEQLALLNTHLRAHDKRLGELLEAHPDTPIFTSFPGIGPVTAAVLISEMGEERSRFPSAPSLLAETGLAPVTKVSGRTRQVRFRYAANRRMRHAIDWWMFVAVREDLWSADIYQHARAAGQPHHRALRGLGARWCRILWRCWHDHNPYDPAIHHRATAA
ncbi:IS110 family transposase [Mycobacterium heckeshornense]|uniref:IS110 family transposase n=3 Tax=Mycobacterium heckeshornense TaxID=110505 RepID=A0A2G8AVD3_9MYCO|nr:IS110 family transposase [Mycobacterium heckeshornense]MCV7033640.1 IS110 family transposase [Mycobacterium heckeshornense]PIJ29415.1 IS110 family transposase [Mycobacterium heckeshornense]BCO33681.1 IS110 family transposase [Mycobacterium heckeshornense]BCO33695.1 IS110 family transposase [Mycobacterium heckeshornense]BCO34888.1 IS110 family transposase [Mycobacterium heckeshornense]